MGMCVDQEKLFFIFFLLKLETTFVSRSTLSYGTKVIDRSLFAFIVVVFVEIKNN